MGRIIKALILGWIGKKIYDRVTDHGDESGPEKAKPSRAAAHRKAASPRRTARKTTSRAA